MHFIRTSRHMGSKSMVAAPLWADKYHMNSEYIMQFTEIMKIIPILH